MSIRAGRLNHKVEIYQQTTTTDNTGQPVKTFTSKGYAWAAVRSMTGSEKANSGREEMATIIYAFELRYSGTLTVTDKIKYNGYMWDIQSLAPRGRMNRDTIEVIAECLEVSTIVK